MALTLLAVNFGNGDYLGVGLVVTLIGAAVAVQRMMHARDVADTARHHELDKRMTLLEQQNALAPILREIVEHLRRDRDPSRSGVHKRGDRDH